MSERDRYEERRQDDKDWESRKARDEAERELREYQMRLARNTTDQAAMGAIFGAVTESTNIPSTTSVPVQGSTASGFSPRLHVPIEDIDPAIVNLIISVQVDPSVPPEYKEALTLKYEAAGIAKHIERLETESPRNSAKIRDLQQKEIQLRRGMTAPQELTRLDKEIKEMEETISSSGWTAPKRILKKQKEKLRQLRTERYVVNQQMEDLRRAGNSWLFPHGDPLASR